MHCRVNEGASLEKVVVALNKIHPVNESIGALAKMQLIPHLAEVKLSLPFRPRIRNALSKATDREVKSRNPSRYDAGQSQPHEDHELLLFENILRAHSSKPSMLSKSHFIASILQITKLMRHNSK